MFLIFSIFFDTFLNSLCCLIIQTPCHIWVGFWWLICLFRLWVFSVLACPVFFCCCCWNLTMIYPVIRTTVNRLLVWGFILTLNNKHSPTRHCPFFLPCWFWVSSDSLFCCLFNCNLLSYWSPVLWWQGVDRRENVL